MFGRKHGLKYWIEKFFPIVKIAFVCLAFMAVLSVPFFGSLFLLNMDRYHECYRDFIINNWLEGDNYYDGELWFAAAATFVGAVISAAPGLMCGIFALVQTQRLHRLEARYHRPAMEIEKIGFSFVKISNIRDERGVLRMDEFDMRQRSGVREANEQSSNWWIDLEIVLFSNNGIPIKNMEIESVVFAFPDTKSDEVHEFKLAAFDGNAARIRRFARDIKDGRAVYTVSWSLYPFKKFKPEDKKTDFEQCINEFAFYNREGWNPRYLHLDFSVNMNVDYEYKDKQETKCLLRAVFNAERSESSERSRNIIVNQSADGYFTYEV